MWLTAMEAEAGTREAMLGAQWWMTPLLTKVGRSCVVGRLVSTQPTWHIQPRDLIGAVLSIGTWIARDKP